MEISDKPIDTLNAKLEKSIGIWFQFSQEDWDDRKTFALKTEAEEKADIIIEIGDKRAVKTFKEFEEWAFGTKGME